MLRIRLLIDIDEYDTLETIAGQFLGLPLVTSSSQTLSHQVLSVSSPPDPTQASSSTYPLPTPLDKITQITFSLNHKFVFKPLGNSVTMDSTIYVFSDNETGKIRRIQDRPVQEITENSIITVRVHSPDSHYYCTLMLNLVWHRSTNLATP